MLVYRDCSGDHDFVLDFMIFHRILNDVDGFSVTSSSDHIFFGDGLWIISVTLASLWGFEPDT